MIPALIAVGALVVLIIVGVYLYIRWLTVGMVPDEPEQPWWRDLHAGDTIDWEDGVDDEAKRDYPTRKDGTV